MACWNLQKTSKITKILIRAEPGVDIDKNLEEKDGQMQLLCYVSLIRACNKVL